MLKMQDLLRPRLRCPIISFQPIPIHQSKPLDKPRSKRRKNKLSLDWKSGKDTLQMGTGAGMGGAVTAVTANNLPQTHCIKHSRILFESRVLNSIPQGC